jgi:hypothetical protein
MCNRVPFAWLQLPTYRFSIRNAAEIEELGFMALPDDAEAVAFATLIIQDMPREDRTQGGSLAITDGERVVGKIPLTGTDGCSHGEPQHRDDEPLIA